MATRNDLWNVSNKMMPRNLVRGASVRSVPTPETMKHQVLGQTSMNANTISKIFSSFAFSGGQTHQTPSQFFQQQQLQEGNVPGFVTGTVPYGQHYAPTTQSPMFEVPPSSSSSSSSPYQAQIIPSQQQQQQQQQTPLPIQPQQQQPVIVPPYPGSLLGRGNSGGGGGNDGSFAVQASNLVPYQRTQNGPVVYFPTPHYSPRFPYSSTVSMYDQFHPDEVAARNAQIQQQQQQQQQYNHRRYGFFREMYNELESFLGFYEPDPNDPYFHMREFHQEMRASIFFQVIIILILIRMLSGIRFT